MLGVASFVENLFRCVLTFLSFFCCLSVCFRHFRIGEEERHSQGSQAGLVYGVVGESSILHLRPVALPHEHIKMLDSPQDIEEFRKAAGAAACEWSTA